jgi:hypothetical protein
MFSALICASLCVSQHLHDEIQQGERAHEDADCSWETCHASTSLTQTSLRFPFITPIPPSENMTRQALDTERGAQ